MAWIVGLRRWVSVAAAVSLAAAAAALIVALAAAAGARAASQELSQRLVPAAASAGVLFEQYVAQTTSLRDHVLSGRGETILLTEDEHSLGQLTSRLLARNGYQVCAAAGAADALRQASDLEQPIDLLLTDVVMPEMLGNEVAARVRALRPGLAVLFMSGYAQPVLDTQGALDPGVDLLEKPFTETTLLTRVRQAIDNRDQPHQPTATDR